MFARKYAFGKIAAVSAELATSSEAFQFLVKKYGNWVLLSYDETLHISFADSNIANHRQNLSLLKI